MAEDPQGGGEKSEDASSKKLSKAREEGQVAKSMEVASVFVLLAGVLALYYSGYHLYTNFLAVMSDSFVFNQVPLLNDVEAVHLLFLYTERIFIMLASLLAAVFVAAFLSNVVQVGFEISWKAIEPKFSKLDPIKGIGKIFSSKSLVEFVKSIMKIVIIFAVAYSAVKGKSIEIARLYDHSTAYILLYILKVCFYIFIKVILIMVLLALLDYAFQKWKFLEDQKMTKQEVKDEHKQTEGDPQIKSRIRRLQAEAAQKRMMAEVPDADVVVTNPTRLAIAVKYDGMTMNAPMVLAKGAGAVAANIRRIAEESNVPLVEDKELARNLYKIVDIGEEVPSELFQSVAEILAYVYKLKGKSL
ncbi:MAG: flagellar biosynthesis protein FlhB [Thermodesulfobacteriota bacterium]|nr:flagellar biosynthesis protein FlhB [Thermodesulfobacteriota bacterium]